MIYNLETHYERIARRTTRTTITRMINKQAIRRPALRWYSCAVVSSSAAEEVFCATEVTLLSMLSVC